eukprot:1254445-Rhodomonas_salina.5
MVGVNDEWSRGQDDDGDDDEDDDDVSDIASIAYLGTGHRVHSVSRYRTSPYSLSQYRTSRISGAGRYPDNRILGDRRGDGCLELVAA